MSSVQFAREELDKLIAEIKNYADKDIRTKKEFILRLKEKTIIFFEQEKRDLKDLSSYIWNLLNNNEFTYNKQHFYELFNENEKGNYSKSTIGYFHKHKFENNKCQCGFVEFEGIIYAPYEEPEQVDETITPVDKQYKSFLPKNYQEYFYEETRNLKELINIINRIIGKTTVEKEDEASRIIRAKQTADNVVSAIPTIEKSVKESFERKAEIKYILKKIDDRESVSKFEKLKAVLLDKCLYNTAKVAKLLKITPKHMAANIKNKEFPEIHANTRNWFKTVEFKDEHGNQIVVDIADWFDKQYSRGQLGLDIKQPFIIKYRVE